MSRKSSRNPSALIREGKLRTATFDVCLDQDLVEEYRTIEVQRDRRLAETADSLAGASAPDLDEQLGALKESIEEATLTLTFRALSRPRFRELCDKHPPRRDDDGNIVVVEDIIGVHFDTFMAEVIPLSLVDNDLTADDLKILVEEKLDDRQYQDMTDVIWDLNRKKVDLPF